MKRGYTIAIVVGTIVALGALFWWLTSGLTLHVLQPTGAVANQQKDLIWLTILLSLIVVIPVFGMLVAFSLRYTDKNKSHAYKPEWHSNTLLEIVWWGIPIIIIGVLATVTWFTSHSLDPYKSIASNQKPLEVQVVALQWKWLFIYPEQRIAVVNELPVIKDRPVHFTLSADAPMSAFWIPTLGSQIYSMNGMSAQLNLVANSSGDFYGYNTNINGEGYAAMRFIVKVRSEKEFNDIVTKARSSAYAMDESTYQLLAQPSIPKTASYYRLNDQGMYHQIVMKYMHGYVPAVPTETMHNHETQHSLEGM